MRCLPEFTGETGWELSGEGEGGGWKGASFGFVVRCSSSINFIFMIGSFRYVNQLEDKRIRVREWAMSIQDISF